MYSLVLMAALSTAPNTVASDATVMVAPAPVVLSGCTGSSCSGSFVMGSCFGSSCTGSSCYSSSACFGSSCHSSSCYSSCGGCTGRSLFPLFPGLRSRLASRFGCTGTSCHSSCYSSSCHSSCYGSACYGSSYRSSCTGSSCTGSSCTGCYGGAVYYGQSSFAPSNVIVVGSSLAGDSYGTITIDNTDTKLATAKLNAAPARITVEVPASAKLYVDGVLKTAEGSVRNFHTPDLAKGQSYYYDLKAEITIDGVTMTDEKRIVVKAGETLNESFPKMVAALKGSKTTELAKK
jgi:uncharacterized protein (TIGR03000 family)